MRFIDLSLAVGLHLSLLPYCAPAALWNSFPAPLSSQKLSLIRANAINISTHSWELGTLAEALTEFEWPRLGVFSPHSIPPPARLAHGQAADVLSIAETVVAENPPGALPAPLINGEGAVGDPASIGVSVLLRSWTLQDPGNTTFADAAARQLEYLLNVAPRAPNGAISHRVSQAQLWADFVYMAPPFIAYYGALLEDGPSCQKLLQTAYDQVRLYREVLYDPSVGLWQHIALGNGTDPTHWGTGNAWAAAGALRVLATIQRSSTARAMKSQQSDLVQWVGEILDGAWQFQQENGTLLNYLDQPDSFPDSSSTALLAASTFRWASITRNNTHIPAATRALRLIRANIDDQGWLLDTVDPETFSTPSLPGAHSPEGQSFVLLLEAAVAAWLPWEVGKA
ncbi:Six-hairpin glycosidase-like protein [Lactarius deliciosus]|nr:Six-hairpin glycosidase-like protein [Lactarius deliciosus]